MSNDTFLIDPTTRDLVIEDGDLVMISGDDTIAQCVRATLLAWLGEWELDTRHGTDYATIFDEQLQDEARIRDIIASAIYQEEDIQHIEQLTVSFSGRELQVSFRALLKSGETVSGTEVVSGG